MPSGNFKQKSGNKHRYRYSDQRCDSNCQRKKNTEPKIFLFVKQAWYVIKRIKIKIGRYEYQIAKLNGYRMGKHQRAVPENKDPENIGCKPKNKMICYFIEFHLSGLLLQITQTKSISTT